MTASQELITGPHQTIHGRVGQAVNFTWGHISGYVRFTALLEWCFNEGYIVGKDVLDKIFRNLPDYRNRVAEIDGGISLYNVTTVESGDYKLSTFIGIDKTAQQTYRLIVIPDINTSTTNPTNKTLSTTQPNTYKQRHNSATTTQPLAQPDDNAVTNQQYTPSQRHGDVEIISQLDDNAVTNQPNTRLVDFTST
ncbi:hypothetical protein ACJMK2_027492 [Sinanodonta woodiana]|uniref:Uncharacterized protein n=1 Tax=Sinanodonta woodiana TaxID=1069815 RepID=A0ABD3XQ26_SINWO